MDSPSNEVPSDWCKRMVDKYLEEGDEETALDYFNLKELWESRGQ